MPNKAHTFKKATSLPTSNVLTALNRIRRNTILRPLLVLTARGGTRSFRLLPNPLFMFRFLFSYRLTLMLSLIILTFCLITVPQTQLSGVDNIDKIVHFIFFFGLSLIAWWESAGRKQHYLSFWTRFFIIGAATAGLGGVIEVLQDTITTNRSGRLARLFSGLRWCVRGANH